MSYESEFYENKTQNDVIKHISIDFYGNSKLKSNFSTNSYVKKTFQFFLHFFLFQVELKRECLKKHYFVLEKLYFLNDNFLYSEKFKDCLALVKVLTKATRDLKCLRCR